MEHFKSPFESGDLVSEGAIENRRFFDAMLARSSRHPFFTHPFLSNSWESALPRETVSFVLTSFYGVVKPFTALLCSLGGRAPTLRSRFALMDNIFEEMGCGDLNAAHPRLYLRMLASMGVSEEAAEAFPVLPSVRRINDHLQEVIERRSFAIACAVFASAEAVIPPVFSVLAKMGQKAFRNIDMTFFDRHGVRDEGHSQDAAMLFSMTADRWDFAVVEHEVQLDLAFRTDLLDHWATVITGARASMARERPASIRPPAAARPSAPPPA